MEILVVKILVFKASKKGNKLNEKNQLSLEIKPGKLTYWFPFLPKERRIYTSKEAREWEVEKGMGKNESMVCIKGDYLTLRNCLEDEKMERPVHKGFNRNIF